MNWFFQNAKGSALLLVMLASAGILSILAAVMPYFFEQINSSHAKHSHVDFRQSMAALFLTYTSPTECTNALKGLTFTAESQSLSNRPLEIIPGRALQVTSGENTLMGMKISSISLNKVEGLGFFDGKKLWFTRLVVKAINSKSKGPKEYTLPLMVFEKNGQIVACNTNSSLLSYDAYFNKTQASKSSSAIVLTSLSVKAQVGETRSVSCPDGEDLLAANYSVLDGKSTPPPYTTYTSLYPLPTVNTNYDSNKAVKITLDVESLVPRCIATGITEAIICRISCARIKT